MRRRELITLLGGSLVWPCVTRAQPVMPVIGFLGGGSAKGYVPFVKAFRQGLRQTGYIEGQNVVIQYLWAEGDRSKAPGLIAELLRLSAGVIVISGGDSVVAEAKAATRVIPIVATFGSDPVDAGMVTNINRPGGNVTGISVFSVQLVEKRLQLARELVANSTIAYLINPTNPQSRIDLREMEDAATKLGQKFVVVAASTEVECDTAFASLVQQDANAVIVESDPVFNGMVERLVTLAERHAIPALFPRREFAAAGGLLSYGTSLTEAYRQLGIYTGRVLGGDKPADLPIVLPTRYETVVNLKTAKALGITIPTDILLRADEVIE